MKAPRDADRGPVILGALLLLAATALLGIAGAEPEPIPGPTGPIVPAAVSDEECLDCHTDGTLGTRTIRGRKVVLDLDPTKLARSVHAGVACVDCHQGYDPDATPHRSGAPQVRCGTCHARIQEEHTHSLHGQAIARGDPLAPYCQICHGAHEILPVKDSRSSVAPLQIPFLCGKCHQEGSPVQLQRVIHQDHILENFSESIHGEGLLRKGLVVAPNCASCHTAHSILPHTNPESSIARQNIARTCATCHAEIELVHRKVIKGELWEKEAHVLPACVDCHQPHKIRKVFYDQGMADRDCLRCHEDPEIRAGSDGRSLTVRASDLAGSSHAATRCSQCHVEVSPSRVRQCETITQKVDCAACHAEISQQYQTSMHGELIRKDEPNAPTCIECHGTHKVLGKADPQSATFPTNVPRLCARCHREGEKAARRYKGSERDIITHYTESIHGKGLMKSGLTVTAMCTNCHTAHSVLPKDDRASSVNRENIPATCGRCHYGIEEQYQRSIHAAGAGKTDKELPVCSDCHSAHTISRTDVTGFKLEIMDKCGRCHEEIAKTYFDTYHGKVSQLGYTKTAKCYDCHGAHDILPISDVRSHLSRQNVVGTCRKCHKGATRRFAGYLTHATHHDPVKYPFLFWTFWGMTSLLIGTFVLGGVHTILWFPRALAMRRSRTARGPAGAPDGEDSIPGGRVDAAAADEVAGAPESAAPDEDRAGHGAADGAEPEDRRGA